MDETDTETLAAKEQYSYSNNECAVGQSDETLTESIHLLDKKSFKEIVKLENLRTVDDVLTEKEVTKGFYTCPEREDVGQDAVKNFFNELIRRHIQKDKLRYEKEKSFMKMLHVQHFIDSVQRCVSNLNLLHSEVRDCLGIGLTEDEEQLQELSIIAPLNQFMEEIKNITDNMKDIFIKPEGLGDCLELLTKSVRETLKELFQQRKEIDRVTKEKTDILMFCKKELEKQQILLKEPEFLKSKIEKLEKEALHWHNSLLEADEKNLEMREIISERNKEIGQLRKENRDQKNKEIDRLTREKTNLQIISKRNKEIARLRKENRDQKNKEIDRLTQEKTDIQMFYKNELGKQKILIKEKNKNEVFLKSEIEKLEKEAIHLHNSLLEFQDLDLENDKLREIISERNKEIGRLQKENRDQKNKEIDRLTQEKADFEKFFKDELENVDNRKKLLIKEKSKNEMFLKSKIEKLEEETLHLHNSLLEFEDLDLENDRLHEIISERNKEIGRLQKENRDQKNKEIDRLTQEKTDFEKFYKNELEIQQLLIKEKSKKQVFWKSKIEKLEEKAEPALDSSKDVKKLNLEDENLREITFDGNKEIDRLRKENSDLRKQHFFKVCKANQQMELNEVSSRIKFHTLHEKYLKLQVENLTEQIRTVGEDDPLVQFTDDLKITCVIL